MYGNMRKHGCVCPPHPYQALAWAVALYTVVVTAIVVVWLLPSWMRIVYAVSFTASGTLLLILGTLMTFSDPTDPVVYEHREAIRLG